MLLSPELYLVRLFPDGILIELSVGNMLDTLKVLFARTISCNILRRQRLCHLMCWGLVLMQVESETAGLFE